MFTKICLTFLLDAAEQVWQQLIQTRILILNLVVQTMTKLPVDNEVYFVNTYPLDLALINRAGGLYGRILTEVVSTDRTQ